MIRSLWCAGLLVLAGCFTPSTSGANAALVSAYVDATADGIIDVAELEQLQALAQELIDAIGDDWQEDTGAYWAQIILNLLAAPPERPVHAQEIQWQSENAKNGSPRSSARPPCGT